MSESWEKAMLSRTALLMQANITNGTTTSVTGTKQFTKNPDFNMSKAYTLIRINAKADVSTTFLNLPITATGINADGTEQFDFTFNDITSSTQTISYVGVDGY